MLDAIISMFLLTGPSLTNYDKVIATIQKIAEQNPANAKVISIGVNDQGVPIQALQIGSGEVGSLIVGTHHGNEYGSTAVALGVADSFARNPVTGQTVYVVPVLNITGYNKTGRNENGIRGSFDPNRDYTGPCKTGATFNLKSTKALSDFLEVKKIQISATLHTYWPAVVYPWGISTQDLSTPYDAQYLELVKAATRESNYKTGNNTELLYPADGTFEDYAYWKHGIWSLLLELRDGSASDIKNSVPAVQAFFDQVDSSPSTRNQMTGTCARRPGYADLRLD